MNKKSDIRTLWNFNKPADSRLTFEKEIKKNLGHKSYILELKTQVARTYGLELQFDKAHEMLDLVKKEIINDHSIENARYFLEKGRVFNSSKKKKEAIIEFTKAFEVSKAIGHEHLIVDSAHMLAIAEDNFENQKKWTETAIKEAKVAKDPKVKEWMGSLLNNWGWSLFENKNYGEALKVFKDALKFRETKDNKDAIIIAKWTIARTLRAMEELDQALDIQLQLEKDWDALEQKDGHVFEEIAEIYFLKNEKDKSKIYFKKAYDELSKDPWLLKNEKSRVDRLLKLSE